MRLVTLSTYFYHTAIKAGIEYLICISKLTSLKNLLTIFTFCLFTTCAFAQKGWGQGGTEIKIVKFYPNPATSYITFDIQRQVEKGFVIQIYNCLGRRVISVNISSNKVTVPLESIFRGLYIFQLRDKNGTIVESNKFQVNK